jgi:hypothetical protein
MNPLKVFLVAVRIALWVGVTGLFWTFVHLSPTHPVITDLAAFALFFVCYALTPRLAFMDRLLKRA